eukprot:TRINITY_DN25106_c0_g1_i2.p1 TRINITY_DN25106_c0_g1~~TRINITY_DN25106_c0_g1_i2.p1  ORF type:complete len:113 (+),score=13.83 TRINITY_DN25106_c0_g1_i2:59-397(+)
MIEKMERVSSCWRVVAILLLLVSALNFAIFDLHAGTPFPSNTSQSEDSCETGGHDCFACCGHIVPATPQAIFAPRQLPNVTDGVQSPIPEFAQIGRAVQQECRDRSRMPSSA